MSRHRRGYGAPAGRVKFNVGDRIVDNPLINVRFAAHLDDTPTPTKEPAQTKPSFISVACKRGNHDVCYSRRCDCDCRHHRF